MIILIFLPLYYTPFFFYEGKFIVTFLQKLLAPVAMNEQDRFAIREGGKTVGSGVITKVIK